MKVIVSIGTNINKRDNMIAVKEYLYAMFPKVRFSRMLYTKPVEGTDNYRYINCLATFDTNMSYEELKAWLKEREQECGRNQEDSQDGYIPLDIDIMEYDGKRYKPKDWEREYNKRLLTEIKKEKS